MFFESEIVGERKRPPSDGRFLLYKGYEKIFFVSCIKDSNSHGCEGHMMLHFSNLPYFFIILASLFACISRLCLISQR